MFTIRTQEMARMNELMEMEYHKKLLKYFRNKIPDLLKSYDDSGLKATIAEASRKARVYGVRSPDGVVRFVGLALAAGPKFDEDPEIHHFLTLAEPDAEQKVQWLVRRIAEKLLES